MTDTNDINLHICSMNVQGLHKFQNDQVFLNFCSTFDFIGMYETWQRHQDDFRNFLNGYTNFDCIRHSKKQSQRGSGGVSVFVKDWFVNKGIVKRIFIEIKECVVLLLNGQIFENVNDIVMVFTYIAPERSLIYSFENDNGITLLNEKIFDIKSLYPNAEIIIAGDLNSRTKDFQDFIPDDDTEFIFGETDYPGDTFNLLRRSKDCHTYDRFGLSLIELCCENDVHMLNGRLFDDVEGKITCIANDGMSIVDYIIASSNLFEKFSSFNVDKYDVSDHFPLKCSLKLCLKRNIRQTNVNTDGLTNWHRYKWKDIHKDDFLYKFDLYYDEFRNKLQLNENNTSSSYLQDFVEVFYSAGDSMKVHYKQSTSFYNIEQPIWWDSACNEAKLKKYRMLRKFRATNSPDDYTAYKTQRNRFKSICKLKKKDSQHKRRSDLIHARQNPKLFWQTIKGNNVSQPTPENTDSLNNEECFQYFATLFSEPEAEANFHNAHILGNITQDNNIDNLEQPITEQEIRTSIQNLNINKSGGPDGLCIEMFKATLDTTLPYLHSLFNDIYDNGLFPEDWCKSIISPIHKAGPVDKPENYRAICLINSLCKIFKNVLTIRLTNWTETNRVIDEPQAGFRKDYSTTDNIFSLHALIQKYLCRERGRFFLYFC